VSTYKVNILVAHTRHQARVFRDEQKKIQGRGFCRGYTVVPTWDTGALRVLETALWRYNNKPWEKTTYELGDVVWAPGADKGRGYDSLCVRIAELQADQIRNEEKVKPEPKRFSNSKTLAYNELEQTNLSPEYLIERTINNTMRELFESLDGPPNFKQFHISTLHNESFGAMTFHVEVETK
jgi:hypothetical protein